MFDCDGCPLNCLLLLQTGVLVSFVEPTSDAHGKIQKGDVILQIEGTSISNDGTVPFRNRERITFDYLILKKYIGDMCNLKLWRDGKVCTLPLSYRVRVDNL